MNDSSLKAVLGTQHKRLQLVGYTHEEEEYQAFSFGRVGQKPQFTVAFKQADGFCEGLSYSDFRGWTTSDGNTSFELLFAGRKIGVEGSNLGRILELIRQHRLSDLTEASRSQAMQCAVNEPVVTKLTRSKA